MVWAAITLERTSIDPTDRSIPAVMMTNVTPTANSKSSDASSAIVTKFSALRKAVPSTIEKAMTSPASMTKINAELRPGIVRRRPAPDSSWRGLVSAIPPHSPLPPHVPSWPPPPNEFEDHPCLSHAQSRRGLVHNDDLASPHHCSGHRYPLALPARESA